MASVCGCCFGAIWRILIVDCTTPIHNRSTRAAAGFSTSFGTPSIKTPTSRTHARFTSRHTSVRVSASVMPGFDSGPSESARAVSGATSVSSRGNRIFPNMASRCGATCAGSTSVSMSGAKTTCCRCSTAAFRVARCTLTHGCANAAISGSQNSGQAVDTAASLDAAAAFINAGILVRTLARPSRAGVLSAWTAVIQSLISRFSVSVRRGV